MSERLALGTVQFGMPYGIANHRGQVSAGEVARIIDRAQAVGIDTLDTAIAYGDSERRLGEVGVSDFRIVTKLPPVPTDVTDTFAWTAASLEGSLARLGVPRLYGVLLHRPADLRGPYGGGITEALTQLQKGGLVEKIGISVYDPAEIGEIETVFPLQLVQTPLNLFDRQVVTSGCLHRLKRKGVEVHTRSAFLQGLLLLPSERRPQAFHLWREHFDRWDGWLNDTGCSALQACIGFVLKQREVDRVVVGVDNVSQLEEIIDAAQRAAVDYPADLESTDKNLIYPARWRAE